MNIRLNRLDGKARICILGVTIFKYGASGTVPDLFQTSKLLNPVLLHSNFAREADYRAPKARVRGVDDPYMPPFDSISLSHTQSLSLSLSLSVSLSLSHSLFCTGGR